MTPFYESVVTKQILSGVAAPIGLFITTVIDIGSNNSPLPITDRLACGLTFTTKTGEIDFGWQSLAHISWTHK